MLLTDKIITDQKILHQISRDTTLEEVKSKCLIGRLRIMNKRGWTEGAGLSAIQIGVPLRVAFISLDGHEEILINPSIISEKIEYVSEEGCLSIPYNIAKVKRFKKIKYISNGKIKKAKGFLACVIQHETDHMNGILNIDKEIL